jgi:hypothetical protein
MAEVKHGGCHDCKSTNQDELISVPNPLTPMMGKAVCNECLKN